MRFLADEDRVLLTEDKGFAELYRSASRTAGVLLARFPASPRATQAAAVVAAVQQLGVRLRGAFVVVHPGRVRGFGLGLRRPVARQLRVPRSRRAAPTSTARP